MSVYKIRLGTPEEFTPIKFAPAPACPVLEKQPEALKDLHFTASPRGSVITFPLSPDAEVYGFGLQMKQLQHKGRKKTLRPNADPVSDTGDSHAPVPFFVTTAGFGVYVDTARYASFYCGRDKRPASAEEAQAGDAWKLTTSFEELYATRRGSDRNLMTVEIPVAQGVDLYYIDGESVLDVVSQYNLFSGGGCLPPMWGLGVIYRCESYFWEGQVFGMADRIRELHIPCDILGLEPGWQSCAYSSSYVWDKERFPNPEHMVRKLTERGFHVNLWEQAFVNPSSPMYQDLIPYSGDYLVWNGLVPDFATPEARKIFADHHKTITDIGVSGFKLDECDGSDFTGGWTFPNCATFPSGMDGEQYHSLFGTLYAKTLMEVMDKPTLSQIRNLGALASSYPFVLYSDLYAMSDYRLATVNAGFSGLLWSPEVRHAANKLELVRRTQMVVFSAQALVNAFYLPEMPWEALDCVDDIRELFRVRMSLLPYLYRAFSDYHTAGKPPVRALACDYEKQPEALSCGTEYLFGDDMLVAPMLSAETEREVWLPDGVWYDFFTGERFEGGKHQRCCDTIPVYVKEGTVLPVAEPLEYVSEDACFAITLRCYGDCRGSSCRLVDDRTGRVIQVDASHTDTGSNRYRIVGITEIR